MRPPDETNDSELEVTPLDARPTARRGGGWLPLSRRWRVALAICVIAGAVAAPLLSLSPTRGAIGALFAGSPTPISAVSPTASAISIADVSSRGSDIAPSVWDKLRAQPLTLPTLAPGAACPAAQGRSVRAGFGPAIGSGPVYIVGMGTDGVLHAVGPTPGDTRGTGSWGYQFSLFIIAPKYSGPVLARGALLDDGRPLLFNGGVDQRAGFSVTSPTLLREMRMEGGAGFGAPWANWMSYLRMQAPGCYGIQFDGATFRETIIFNVTFSG